MVLVIFFYYLYYYILLVFLRQQWRASALLSHFFLFVSVLCFLSAQALFCCTVRYFLQYHQVLFAHLSAHSLQCDNFLPQLGIFTKIPLFLYKWQIVKTSSFENFLTYDFNILLNFCTSGKLLRCLVLKISSHMILIYCWLLMLIVDCW